MTESLSMPFCHSWTQDRPGSLLGSVLLGTGPGRRETSQPRAKDPGRLFPTPALGHGPSLQLCKPPPTEGGRSQGCVSGGLGGEDWEEA